MIQLLICIIFFFDFWFLFFLKERKWHYFITHILFLVVSIPYLNIIDWFGIEVSPFMNILLRSILLIRGGYGMVIMITWFTTSKMTNLLLSYIAILLGSSYFGSLAFFSLEKNVNNGLRDFGDAVWWACMDVTTVGCDIEPVTSEGRILGVILAVMGMSVFPILTAYITTRFQQKMQNKS
ncbi:MAG: potassium channel family protein [Bacteroidales bacterium]